VPDDTLPFRLVSVSQIFFELVLRLGRNSSARNGSSFARLMGSCERRPIAFLFRNSHSVQRMVQSRNRKRRGLMLYKFWVTGLVVLRRGIMSSRWMHGSFKSRQASFSSLNFLSIKYFFDHVSSSFLQFLCVVFPRVLFHGTTEF